MKMRYWLLAALSTSMLSCNESSFTASQESPEQAALPEGSDLEEQPAEDPIKSVVVEKQLAESLLDIKVDGDFKGGFEVKSLSPDQAQHIWLATRGYAGAQRSGDGIARHIKIEGDQLSVKSWTGLRAPGAGGTRTYVLEGGGVILAKQGGHLYFLHDGIPEGAVSEDPALGYYYKIPGVTNQEARSCAVSYRRDGKRYIGVGYDQGMFIEFAQSDTPPYAPDFQNPTAVKKIHDSVWGYSCYIDQVKLVYYAQNLRANTGVHAVDLKKLESVAVANVAANINFNSNNLPAISVGAKGSAALAGSYALNGDRMSNVYNATGYYTMSYEAKNKVVWASQASVLHLYPHSCLYELANCAGFASYDLMDPNTGIGAAVGPLSALGDGRMLGLVRNASNSLGAGEVFAFSLNDPNDLSGGISAQKIAEIPNQDPYMYTDFTGATLYLNNSLNEYDFAKLGFWQEGESLKQLSFVWQAEPGARWEDIKTEIRCYLDPENKGEFEEIEIKATPGQQQFLESCVGKQVRYAELRLTQLNNKSSLMQVEKVQLSAFQ